MYKEHKISSGLDPENKLVAHAADKEALDEIRRAGAVVDAALRSGLLLTVPEAARRTGFSTNHLSGLAANGTIAGMKLGGQWLIPIDAISEYIRKDHRPGRKPKNQLDGESSKALR